MFFFSLFECPTIAANIIFYSNFILFLISAEKPLVKAIQ